MIEYSILIGLISAAAIALIVALGGFVTSAWTELCTDIDGSTTAGGMITCP